MSEGLAFRASLKTNPSDIPARYYLGLCLLRQDQYREALELFQNVPRSRDRAEQPPVPSQYQIQIALAQAHLGLKQYDEAWENLESAKTLAPRSPEVYVCQGRYYLEREKYQEAIQELEKAISIDENNAEAYYYEGLAYYGAGMPESAVTALKKFLQLAPYAPEAGKAREIIAKLC